MKYIISQKNNELYIEHKNSKILSLQDTASLYINDKDLIDNKHVPIGLRITALNAKLNNELKKETIVKELLHRSPYLTTYFVNILFDLLYEKYQSRRLIEQQLSVIAFNELCSEDVIMMLINHNIIRYEYIANHTPHNPYEWQVEHRPIYKIDNIFKNRDRYAKWFLDNYITKNYVHYDTKYMPVNHISLATNMFSFKINQIYRHIINQYLNDVSPNAYLAEKLKIEKDIPIDKKFMEIKDNRNIIEPIISEEIATKKLITEKKFDELDMNNMEQPMLINNTYSNVICKEITDRDKFTRWDMLSSTPDLPLDFIDKYKDKLNWKILLRVQKLPKQFILEHIDNIILTPLTNIKPNEELYIHEDNIVSINEKNIVRCMYAYEYQHVNIFNRIGTTSADVYRFDDRREYYESLCI